MLGRSNVFLIGPMGSGKTAVGRYLSRLLDCPFYDSDHEVEQRTGADIPLIFEREGEAGFRRREREAIEELTGRHGIVLATGGGAILSADTRRELGARGWVVYLEASIAQQAARAARARNRPLLQDTDPMVRLAELMQVREPLYREIADLVVSTNNRKVSSVAEHIAREYQAARALQAAERGAEAGAERGGRRATSGRVSLVSPHAMHSPTATAAATSGSTTTRAPAPQVLQVALGERSYPILLGSGLIQSAELLARYLPHRDILLVSNTVVAPLYADAFERALSQEVSTSGVRRIVRVVLPDGEEHKTLATAGRVFDVLVANRFGRDALVVALGGGVVGDLAGFVAACYQRGVDLVQVPTTLLAHVDSAVGGKTAVNHPGGKNLIGAFHQPRAVIADTELLHTLPDRELSAGLAEVIKYGLIRDAALFDWIEQKVEAMLAREPSALAHAIRRSCEVKAQIVAHDEREQGERALLNLGHTFGHAIESASAYVGTLHGEAVAVGLLIATDLACRLGLADAALLVRLRALLERARLPVRAPQIGARRALEYMRIDKKVQSGRVRLVLPVGLGDATVSADYPDAALAQTLDSWFGP